MPVDRYEILRRRTIKEYPRFNVKERDKSWLRPLFWLLSKITRRPYKGFTTTIFSTMYVDPSWSQETSTNKYAILRHEKQHIAQFHRWPLGRWAWPLNHVITAVCYLLVLPVLWTLRAYFERAGYTQTLLVQAELQGHPLTEEQMEENATWLAEVFGGSSYLFMWRRRAAYAWAMNTQRRINAGEIANPVDRVDELRAA